MKGEHMYMVRRITLADVVKPFILHSHLPSFTSIHCCVYFRLDFESLLSNRGSQQVERLAPDAIPTSTFQF